MKAFSGGMRVEVTSDGPLKGKRCTVHRMLMSDEGAWVKMDEDLPDDLRRFAKGDPRKRHVLLYPEECEPIVTGDV